MRDQASQEPLEHPGRSRIAVGAGPLVASGANNSSPANDAATICDRWMANGAEIERLQGRWDRLETWLARNHRWYELTDADQRRLEAARDLYAIDRRLDVLTGERDALLAKLQALPAPNLPGVAAKIAVVTKLIWREDHPEVHFLLASLLRDISSLLEGSL